MLDVTYWRRKLAHEIMTSTESSIKLGHDLDMLDREIESAPLVRSDHRDLLEMDASLVWNLG